MAQADRYGVPRIAFVNKMDRMGADFFEAVATMREKLHANAVAVHCPIGAEGEFKGMVDLIDMKAYFFHDETLGAEWDETEIPADMLEKCKEMRTELLEELATVDEKMIPLSRKVLENPESLTEKKSTLPSAKGYCAKQTQSRPLR